MKWSKKRIVVFAGLLITAILILVFSLKGWSNGLNNGLQSLTLPMLKSAYVFWHKEDGSQITKLKNENRELLTRLVKMTALERDNQALRDQFATTNPVSNNLLPATIVSMPTLLTGFSYVDVIVIDRGSRDGVKKGSYVVYKDNLIGKVERTSVNMSVVNLLNHKGISFTAQTSKTSAFGINKGIGEEMMLFENVAQSDRLEINDTIITNDPQKLVVGKIVSINKKASSIFQSAKIISLVDIEKLQMVFVLISDKQ